MAHLARTRVHRSLVATLLGLALLAFVSACGMNAQTLQPYQPAEGVNFDVGPAGNAVQVRNLMILSHEDGQGVVSATLVAADTDSLTAIAGYPLKVDNSQGSAFKVGMPGPVALTPGLPVVLTASELITVTSPDLVLGGTAELTLSFSTVGDHTVQVPVIDGNQPDYQTITPSPTPSS